MPSTDDVLYDLARMERYGKLRDLITLSPEQKKEIAYQQGVDVRTVQRWLSPNATEKRAPLDVDWKPSSLRIIQNAAFEDFAGKAANTITRRVYPCGEDDDWEPGDEDTLLLVSTSDEHSAMIAVAGVVTGNLEPWVNGMVDAVWTESATEVWVHYCSAARKAYEPGMWDPTGGLNADAEEVAVEWHIDLDLILLALSYP